MKVIIIFEAILNILVALDEVQAKHNIMLQMVWLTWANGPATSPELLDSKPPYAPIDPMTDVYFKNMHKIPWDQYMAYEANEAAQTSNLEFEKHMLQMTIA